MTVRVLRGDCLSLLLMLPAGSAHTCVTSPPYFGLRDYGVAGQIGLEETPAQYVAKLVEVFREVRRVLRDDGTLWLNLGDSYAGSSAQRKQSNIGSIPPGSGLKPKDLIGIPWLVALALRADGWYLRQDIIWAKPNPMPESVRDRCTKAHEYIFLLAKSERYYFDADAIAEPANPKNHRDSATRRRDTPPGTNTDSGFANGRHYNERNKRSVWTVTTKPFKGAHFATFPPDLIEPCILAGSPIGGTVLDPFGGAGTTGLVAQRHGRNAILCELNPEYATMAEERIAADQHKQLEALL
jgi:DNA modification methylase